MLFTVLLPDFIDPEGREATYENLITLSRSQLVDVLEWLEVEFEFDQDAAESELVQLALWEIKRSEDGFTSWYQSDMGLYLSSCSLTGYQQVELADTWSGAESGGSDSVTWSVLEGVPEVSEVPSETEVSGEGEEGSPTVDLGDTMFNSWCGVAEEVEPSQTVFEGEERQSTPVILSESSVDDWCGVSPGEEVVQSAVTVETSQEPVVSPAVRRAVAQLSDSQVGAKAVNISPTSYVTLREWKLSRFEQHGSGYRSCSGY